MSLIVSEQEREYRLPPEGMMSGVCCDVQDKGEELNAFNGKMQRKVRLVFQIDELHPDFKRPFEVSSTYVLSLHEKANLRKVLATWRGRDFTAQELKGFDLEKLIGIPCQVQVQHRTSAKGRTFANVVAIVPLGKGMKALAVSPDYKRLKDREGYAPPIGASSEPPAEVDEDGSTPF